MSLEGLPSSDFERSLVFLNGLWELSSWVFHKGMLFLSTIAWWKEGPRGRPHEGLDICFFRDKEGHLKSLSTETIVPSPYDGMVVSLIPDFIGHSVFATLEVEEGQKLLWALGHIIPKPGLQKGARVHGGEPVGTIAQVKKGGSRLKAHLHVSIAEYRCSYLSLNWDLMGQDSSIHLLDPLPLLIRGPWELIP